MLIKLVFAAKSTVPPLDLPTASSAPSFRKDCYTYADHEYDNNLTTTLHQSIDLLTLSIFPFSPKDEHHTNHVSLSSLQRPASVMRTLYSYKSGLIVIRNWRGIVYQGEFAMTGRKRNVAQTAAAEKDEAYVEKRRRNNEAVNRQVFLVSS
ncbi:hypothetical protein Y032_0120g949 [Ancylostoma ceylanicum]|nr:hypothetical protein Y032_0120g949 [Ancylostoma ceylanicum]